MNALTELLLTALDRLLVFEAAQDEAYAKFRNGETDAQPEIDAARNFAPWKLILHSLCREKSVRECLRSLSDCGEGTVWGDSDVDTEWEHSVREYLANVRADSVWRNGLSYGPLEDVFDALDGTDFVKELVKELKREFPEFPIPTALSGPSNELDGELESDYMLGESHLTAKFCDQEYNLPTPNLHRWAGDDGCPYLQGRKLRMRRIQVSSKSKKKVKCFHLTDIQTIYDYISTGHS